MTIVVQSNSPNISLEWITFGLNSQGEFQPQFDNRTIAMLDRGAKECGQLIFAENLPNVNNRLSQYPCITDLKYDLQGQNKTEIQILVGLYPVSDQDMATQVNINKLLANHIQTAQNPSLILPLTTFDYQTTLQQYSVSYIANRDFELNPKFANDPRFNLVFINSEVAIFKVKVN